MIEFFLLKFSSITNLILANITLFIVILLVMTFSPEQKKWSQIIIISLILILSIRYIIWRLSNSLNMDNYLNLFFSLLLLAMEMFIIISNTFQMLLIATIRNKSQEFTEKNKAVIDGIYKPSVDIFITTYNESPNILTRTVMGCQLLNYDKKTVYLLDDGHRKKIKELSKNLGCEYISRATNLYAKAGNINNALSKTSGDLIVIFDADFIPTNNFLLKTIGMFQNQKVGCVQTNQSYYNPDPIAYNLGLQDIIPQEAEMFSSHYQLLRDGVNASGCYGTGVIFQRKALEDIGGFVTNSITEDYYTGIKLASKGYQIRYLNDKLSAGLSAENMEIHLGQRYRWSRGTLQAFFLDSNPCTIQGLNFIQRLTHLEGILHWFIYIPRLYFLLTPLLYLYFQILPIKATTNELISLCLPYYLSYWVSSVWLNQKTRSFLISDLYSLIHCFSLSINFFNVILNPFSKGFNVTPKGISRNTYYFNFNMIKPLAIILIVNLLGVIYNIALMSKISFNILHILFVVWSVYNIIMLFVAILSLIDSPKDEQEKFELEKKVLLKISNMDILGTTQTISEYGTQIKIEQQAKSDQILKGDFCQINFIDESMTIDAIITDSSSHTHKLELLFNSIGLQEKRYLINLLFCQPNQWKKIDSPNEFHTFCILLNASFTKIKNLCIYFKTRVK